MEITNIEPPEKKKRMKEKHNCQDIMQISTCGCGWFPGLFTDQKKVLHLKQLK